MLQKIMVPVDGSSFAEAAVAPAALIAQQTGAELHLVLVNSQGDDAGATPQCATRRYADHQLKALASSVTERSGVPVVTAALRGEIIECLGRYSSHVSADLIVMATHGRTGLSRVLVGSFADDLLHAVQAPLILLRAGYDAAGPGAPFRRILVGLDGSADAEHALELAIPIAKAAGASVTLVQVVVPVPVEVNLAVTAGVVLTDAEATQRLVDSAYRYLDGLAAGIRVNDAIEVDVVVDMGMAVSTIAVAATAIIKLARERRIDLVVLTTHERSGSRILVRSVADRVLQETQCALLLCHRLRVPAFACAVTPPGR